MSTFFFVFLFLYNWVAGASWKRNKGNNPRGHGPGKRRRRGMYRLAFTGCFFFSFPLGDEEAGAWAKEEEEEEDADDGRRG
jgi:hypothetical protein